MTKRRTEKPEKTHTGMTEGTKVKPNKKAITKKARTQKCRA